MPSSSICEYCGSTLRSDQQFCPNCGAAVTSLGHKNCEYCGAVIKEVSRRVWELSSIEEV